MMFDKTIKIIQVLATRISHPLPNPKKEAWKFFDAALHKLLFEHIKEIVRLVIDEARRSREFGLYIEAEHFEKEELFFLAAINELGGIWPMRKHVLFEEAQKAVSRNMHSFFEAEKRFYFEQAKRRGESVLNKYNCHLEAVRNRVLREIYFVPKKEFHTL